MTYVYLDIETLPADWNADQKRAYATKRVPKTHKKPDAIQAWIEENEERLWRDTSFDPLRGRLACVGLAINDMDPLCWAHPDPAELLEKVRSEVGLYVDGSEPVFVGHNVRTFDIPFLRKLAFRFHPLLARALPSTRWSKAIHDTMEMWAGTDYQDKTSLGDIAEFLGLGSKTPGIDGSMVADLWRSPDGAVQVMEYCRQDVNLTRRIHRHLLGD